MKMITIRDGKVFGEIRRASKIETLGKSVDIHFIFDQVDLDYVEEKVSLALKNAFNAKVNALVKKGKSESECGILDGIAVVQVARNARQERSEEEKLQDAISKIARKCNVPVSKLEELLKSLSLDERD